ncbi:MAG: PD-(D/E)XK nuclease family protein [Bacteroidales bacterium]
MKETLDTLNRFYIKYNCEKEKLPYHLNILDLIHANENAHSRIFMNLLAYCKDKEYPYLKELFHLLGEPFDKLEIKNPAFSAEKYRIDLLIQDISGGYAIIVENKIHGAVDQDGQLASYVKRLEELGFRKQHIYILYLTKSGGTPSEKSLPIDMKKEIDDKYKEINYKQHVLPWLEYYVLPNTVLKEDYLISSIKQYIDYLKGVFHIRKNNDAMNDEIEKWLTSELKLNNDRALSMEILKEKKEQVEEFQKYIDKLQQKHVKAYFTKWKSMLSEKYGNYVIKSNIACESPDNEFFYLGIEKKHLDVSFLIAIGLDNYYEKPYIGLTIRDCSSSKNDTLNKYIVENFEKEDFVNSPRWYLLKEYDFTHIWSEYIKLIDKVLNS